MGKNTLKLDVKGFDEYAEKLERLGANLQSIFTDALEQAAETVEYDTLEALADKNMPAKGKYRRKPSKTEQSLIRNAKVQWNGPYGEIAVGFDYSKKGAGGYLITGTPRMRPNKALNRIYKSKRYMSEIKKDMMDIFEDELAQRMGG